jgi:predicted acyl esterase
VAVDLGQLGYRIRAGHRLRVHVSSSDYPEFIPQPGTGEEPWSAVTMRANTQTMTLGGTDPFRITLSVLEGEPA